MGQHTDEQWHCRLLSHVLLRSSMRPSPINESDSAADVEHDGGQVSTTGVHVDWCVRKVRGTPMPQMRCLSDGVQFALVSQKISMCLNLHLSTLVSRGDW